MLQTLQVGPAPVEIVSAHGLPIFTLEQRRAFALRGRRPACVTGALETACASMAQSKLVVFFLALDVRVARLSPLRRSFDETAGGWASRAAGGRGISPISGHSQSVLRPGNLRESVGLRPECLRAWCPVRRGGGLRTVGGSPLRVSPFW